MTEVPVQTQFGWHVIRLEDVRETQFPPLEQVAPQIRESLQQQKAQEFVANLTKSAKIQ
jgi:peptidyl-prolyl cis-trans isomerase C